MYRYFIVLVFLLLLPLGRLSAQLENMTQEEMKKKAEQMGFSLEDYLKLQQQLQNSQLQPQQSVTKNSNVKEKQDAPKIIPPVNKPLESYFVPAFKGRAHADSLPAFGYDIFSTSYSAFETSLNVPVPANYIVGPGDEIVITMWGETQLERTLTVNKEGNIYIPDVGLINVNGLSIQGLKQKLYNILSKTYSSLSTDKNGEAKTSLDVSTGTLRTIKVYVLGEVNKPGGYTLPSLSTSFTALYYSGGPSLNGSLRDIKIIRNEQTVSVIDLYSYLTRGDKSRDVNLEDGDIIFIPPVGQRVALSGEVFRPSIYELKKDDRLEDLLNYAGGLNFNAYYERVHIERIIPFGQRKEFKNNIMDIDLNFNSVDDLKNSSYSLSDGDVVNILKINNKPENRVTIRGKVRKPGVYELTSSFMTIRDLIYKADSLSPDAFKEKGILTRTLPDEKQEIINFNLQKALEGNPSDNLVLKNRDEIEIYSIEMFFPSRTVEIAGAVKYPGIFKRYNNMTLTDLIILAGGLSDSATTNDIEVTRMDTTSSTIYADKFIISLPENYWDNSLSKGFYLKDYDRVLIKRNPTKTFNQIVSISGEVKFPGTYTLLYEGEKVYDLIKRAGKFKSTAYTAGMYVYRKNSIFVSTQKFIIPDTVKIRTKDVPIYDRNILNREYSNRIPILWEDILEDTNSIYNIPLEPGDSLVVPKNPNVIYVVGEVGIPSSVPYMKGGSLKYYIDQAGSYTENSGKGYEIVILPNGKKWNPSSWFFIPNPEILSGSTIIVPTLIESESKFWPIVRDMAAVVTSTAVLILTVNNLTR
jgi:protein involved in polysaccharide export with SLBB domain